MLGPANTVTSALAILDRERPDVALLDLDLNGERSTPVASALAAQDVPFALVTAYGAVAVTEPALLDAPRLDKPTDPRLLLQVLSELAGQA